MFQICPECANDKLKVKTTEQRLYDPATARTIVNEEVLISEYHCAACGWSVLLEDTELLAEREARSTIV